MTCDWNITFDNGQALFVQQFGKLEVHRPTADKVAGSDSEPRFFWVETGAVYVTLSYGIPPVPLNDSGRGKLTYDVRVRSDFPGHGGITQIATLDYNTSAFQVTDYVDGSEFYSSKQIFENSHTFLSPPTPYIPDVNDINLNDLPSIGLPRFWGKLRLKGTFKDYVRFRPDGTDNIYVTLGLVTWQMHAQSEAPNWELTVDEHPAPSEVDPSRDSFPTWYGEIVTNQSN